MHHAFNSGDSARFFPALKNLEDYLLAQGDLHAYYTQRCNEIVFQMNRQRIFEAYKLARELTKELSEKKLDKEMYMAYNMLGHLNRYCGNRETAKENFRKVIKMMEKAGYYESMPPIYMNLVNVALDDDPKEADEIVTLIYERAGRWQEAYASLKKEALANDSINNVILINSMQGFRDELRVYDIERETTHQRAVTLIVTIVLLLLIVALCYISFSRQRYEETDAALPAPYVTDRDSVGVW